MTVKRGPYSSPRQQARQERILACTREAISVAGYDALTMKDLAESSEVSVKTLYNLYGSKDELVLAAVADLLADLAELPEVAGAEAGIERILASVAATSAQITATPEYADTMAKALFQAGRDHALVDVLLGNARRLLQESLLAATEKGQLIEGVDIEATATIMAGHQWSVVLMWNKGLLDLTQLESAAMQSQLMTLLPLCTDIVRSELENQLW